MRRLFALLLAILSSGSSLADDKSALSRLADLGIRFYGVPFPQNDAKAWKREDCSALNGAGAFPPTGKEVSACLIDVKVEAAGDGCIVLTDSVPGVIFVPDKTKLILFRLDQTKAKFVKAPVLPGKETSLKRYGPVSVGGFSYVALQRIDAKNEVIPYTLIADLSSGDGVPCHYGPLIINRE